MQKLVVTIICLFATWNLSAQSPKNEFLFNTKTTRAELNKGETNHLDLNIVRSKRYEDSEMKLSVGSGLPNGVQVSFQSADDTANTATAAIVASEAAVAGTYNVVLNCTINNKTKGIIVKLIVLE
jgi:hypothetical protein